MNTEEIVDLNLKDLISASQDITERYRAGKSLVTEAQKKAYLVVRMPATSAVIRRVLKEVNEPIASALDLGAGPGSAIEPLLERFPAIQKMTLMERDHTFIEMGKTLFLQPEVAWVEADVHREQRFEPHDLLLISYAFAEMSEAAIGRLVPLVWEASKKYLVIIEPGTPAGFARVKKIREQLISLGGQCIAPCPHSNRCPMQGSDWCHFSERIERSSLHRGVKLGTLGYEDEKFSYLIVAKTSAPSHSMRILRPPLKRSGHISFSVCMDDGVKIKTISRKDKEKYVLAKKLDWGDSL